MAKRDDSRSQVDRWSLLLGDWALTFFALGVALKLAEQSSRTR